MQSNKEKIMWYASFSLEGAEMVLTVESCRVVVKQRNINVCYCSDVQKMERIRNAIGWQMVHSRETQSCLFETREDAIKAIYSRVKKTLEYAKTSYINARRRLALTTRIIAGEDTTTQIKEPKRVKSDSSK